MWKYILIMIVLLFTIREINLMNQSIYIEPGSNQLIVEDNTIISKILKVLGILKTKMTPVIQIPQSNFTESIDPNNTKIKPLYTNTIATVAVKDNKSLFFSDTINPDETTIKSIVETNTSKTQNPANISYPKGFESAQDKVNTILQEMKQH